VTLFDIIGDVLTKKSGYLHTDPDFDKTMSSYMLVRYLSMSDKLLPYVEVLNSIQCTLDKVQFYKFAYKIIPKQNSGFIKYYVTKPKKKKAINRDNDDEG
jgi:hypothetical protein